MKLSDMYPYDPQNKTPGMTQTPETPSVEVPVERKSRKRVTVEKENDTLLVKGPLDKQSLEEFRMNLLKGDTSGNWGVPIIPGSKEFYSTGETHVHYWESDGVHNLAQRSSVGVSGSSNTQAHHILVMHCGCGEMMVKDILSHVQTHPEDNT